MLEYPFIRTALGGTLAIAVVCAYLGVFVVLRRIVFVGATLAQVSSIGVALGLLTGASPNALSVAATLVAVIAFAHPSFGRRWPQDATLGVVFTVSGALAVLLVAHTARGNEEVVHLVQGNLLAMTAVEARWLAIAFAGILLGVAAFHKELLYVAFDPAMAATQGYRVGGWNLAFYLVLGIAIALAMKAIGILLMFALLVVPAAIGLALTRSVGGALAWAAGSAAASVYVGIYLSYRFDFPPSPMIVVVLGAGLAVAGVARLAAR